MEKRRRGRRGGRGGGWQRRGPRKDFCLSFPTHTLSIPKFANGFIWFLFEERGEGEELEEGLGTRERIDLKIVPVSLSSDAQASGFYSEKTNSQRSQGSPFGGGLHISGHQRTIEQITSSRVLNGPLVPWEEPVYLQKVSCLLPESRILAVMQAHPSFPIPGRHLGCR